MALQFHTEVLQAMLLGFAVAAPIGPVGMLCIQRSLGGSALCGLATGLGAAAVGALWIFLAVTGFVSQASAEAHPAVMPVLTLVASGILLRSGLKAAGQRNSAILACPGARTPHLPSGGAFATGALTSMINPATALLYLSTARTLVPDHGFAPAGPLLLALSTFAGAALWWSCLSFGTAAIRDRLSESILEASGRLGGLAMIAMAAMLLMRLFLPEAAAIGPSPASDMQSLSSLAPHRGPLA